MSSFSFLSIIKEGHRYFIKYPVGEEKSLFFALIDYGKNKEFNLSLIEALHLIRKISAYLRGNGYSMNQNFTITPEEGGNL